VRRLVLCWLAAAAIAGCGGGDEDIGAQNDRLAGELWNELDGAAFETKFDAPGAVDCARPRPEHFLCTAYFQVADDVALTAEYRVVDCGLDWRGLAIDAHKQLTVPARLAHEREIDVGCPWAVPRPRAWRSGSFLRLEEDQ
jgi:hypothetical protein